MSGEKAGDIVAALAFFAGGGWLVWEILCALRSGKFGPEGPLPGLPAERSSHPALYALWFATYGFFAATCMAILVPLFSGKDDPAFVTAFLLALGLAASSLSLLNASYLVIGFRLGKCVLLSDYSIVRVVYDRARSPGWYWTAFATNVVVVMVLGTLGVGALFLVSLLF